ncbi:MAG: helix-turn-helix domain-containing protein [Microlunatus sp.]|nr:helix-turn-helix domain-containing protein [Microlunatus sp.]
MQDRRRADETWRAHLRDQRGFAPPLYRYPASEGVTDLIRSFWVPVWDLPRGEVSRQRVLNHPVANLVVGNEYAQVVGPRPNLTGKELRGRGWVFGAMLAPATGMLLTGRPIKEIVDTDVDLVSMTTVPAQQLIRDVRTLMTPDPHSVDAHLRAIRHVEEVLAHTLSIDDEGLLINAVVEFCESRPEVVRVTQICREFAVSERSLQRLASRRIGFSPKWLIQRRRLHEAALNLAHRDAPALADLAVDLGYADQSHFIRDFKAVTGMTPAAYSAEPR